MSDMLSPRSEEEVAETVADAASRGRRLAIEGQGTKSSLGRPVVADAVLSLAGLRGITLYEPDEMVVTVRAGTPLELVQRELALHGQCLAFEPSGLETFLGVNGREATIGGTIAAGMAGPRRFAAGAARDHLLGFTAVDGEGQVFRAGGKVVKNVTGYDLPKLAAGSFGTLFVMTEFTLRALPVPAATRYVAIEGLPAGAALSALRLAAAAPHEPSGLCCLPPAMAVGFTGRERMLCAARIEGQPAGVEARARMTAEILGPGAFELSPGDGGRIFAALRDLDLPFPGGCDVWKLSVPPTAAPDALANLEPASWVADAAGGTLWLALPRNSDRLALHLAARKLGGHMTLFRPASGSAWAGHPFPPLDEATLMLTSRVKSAFDPAGIFNCGRMYEGI